MSHEYIVSSANKESSMSRVFNSLKTGLKKKYYKAAARMKRDYVKPFDYAPIIRLAGKRKIETIPMRWGFDDPIFGSVVINVRFEGIRNRPVFSEAIRKRRCIIPMTGFFEVKNNGLSPERYKISDTYYETMFAAGIYNQFFDAAINSSSMEFTILTRQATGILRSFGDRMPVFIPKNEIFGWLGEYNIDPYYYCPVPDFSFSNLGPVTKLVPVKE